MAEQDAIAALTVIIHDARMAWDGDADVAHDDYDLDRHIAEAIAAATRVLTETPSSDTPGGQESGIVADPSPADLTPGQRVWMVIQGQEEDGPQLVEVMRYDPEWSMWEVRPVGDDGRVMNVDPYVGVPGDVVPAPTQSAPSLTDESEGSPVLDAASNAPTTQVHDA